MRFRAQRFALPRKTSSAVPAEGDLVEHARAEFFRRAGDGLAAERAIELDRGVVFRQRPDDQAFNPLCARSRRAAVNRRAAEAEPLKFGPQIELVDFAVVVQAARAVASVIGVARDLVAERQDARCGCLCGWRCPTNPGRGD